VYRFKYFYYTCSCIMVSSIHSLAADQHEDAFLVEVYCSGILLFLVSVILLEMGICYFCYVVFNYFKHNV